MYNSKQNLCVYFAISLVYANFALHNIEMRGGTLKNQRRALPMATRPGFLNESLRYA